MKWGCCGGAQRGLSNSSVCVMLDSILMNWSLSISGGGFSCLWFTAFLQQWIGLQSVLQGEKQIKCVSTWFLVIVLLFCAVLDGYHIHPSCVCQWFLCKKHVELVYLEPWHDQCNCWSKSVSVLLSRLVISSYSFFITLVMVGHLQWLLFRIHGSKSPKGYVVCQFRV